MDIKKYLGGDISVYVGTYGKYASGSIKGAWVNMEAVKDVDQFWRICHTIHRERAPEFMFQDYQGFPDWLYSESMGSEEIAEILHYAHATPEERAVIACEDEDPSPSTTGAGSDAAVLAERLRQALLAKMGKADPATSPAPTGVGRAADYKAWLEEYCAMKGKDADYYRKGNVGAVKVQEKYWLISKPSIESRFCFHDEGPDYEFYCELMKDREHRLANYFKGENLARFDCIIDRIEKGEDYSGDKRVWLESCYNDGRVEIALDTHWRNEENLTLCTPEERALILDGAKYGRAMFERRLDTYLKRYGVNKIHTWTYWADA